MLHFDAEKNWNSLNGIMDDEYKTAGSMPGAKEHSNLGGVSTFTVVFLY